MPTIHSYDDVGRDIKMGIISMKKRRLPTIALILALVCPILFSATDDGQPFRRAVQSMGIRLELQVDHAEAGKTPGLFHENDHVQIAFKITDLAGGAPMKSLYPAAWMDPAPENAPAVPCVQKVKTFLGGSVFTRAEIDLNVFLVVTLTTDGFITVVDPLFSFGGSKLLGMVELASPGADWVLSRDQRWLYVTLPAAGQLVEIDTSTWQIHRSVDINVQPRVLRLQPDQHYLWVSYGEPGSQESGVAAVVRETMTVAQRIPTGAGFHDLEMDRDAKTLFVSNSQAGTVSIIDIRNLSKVKDIPTGPQPTDMTYSPNAQVVLVADYSDGHITAIDAATRSPRGRMEANKGLRQVEFAPDGRFALAISPQTNGLFIVDAARNRVIQSSRLNATPANISFSDTLGYIMFEDTDQTLMAPLGEIGLEGAPIPLADFPGGYYQVPALGEPLLRAVSKAPAENGVMLADTRADTINYYMEGMAAPMGSFQNYHHPPKGILVIDRSLQETTEPGLYQTVTKLGEAGTYDVVVFLDTPRMVHCFQLSVLPDPAKPATAVAKLQHLTQGREFPVGEKKTLAVKLSNADGQGITDLTDVILIAHMAGGRWFERMRVTHRGDGIYTADIQVPIAGAVQAFVQCESAGLTFANAPSLALRATAKPPSDPPTDTGGSPK